EEFALLTPGGSLVTAAILAETVRTRLSRRRFSSNGQAFTSSVSAGVSHAEHGRLVFDDMLRDADKALYAAKQNGRNKVAVSGGDIEVLAHGPSSSGRQRGPADFAQLKAGPGSRSASQRGLPFDRPKPASTAQYDGKHQSSA